MTVGACIGGTRAPAREGWRASPDALGFLLSALLLFLIAG